jgi:hypothetical protein
MKDAEKVKKKVTINNTNLTIILMLYGLSNRSMILTKTMIAVCLNSNGSGEEE